TCKISGCLSYRILDSGPDGTQTTLTCDLLRNGINHIPMAKLFPDTDKIITCMAPSKTFNLAGNLMSHIFIKNEKVRKEWLRLALLNK
ncbi:hypothetical protein AB2881_27095, partial [Escherichia coli]|nr:hypothetical protein [Citrobacter freundii]